MTLLFFRYKNNTYRASVALVTSADEVPDFCKNICNKLQVCPFLFGPVSIGDKKCPENCNTLSKTRFSKLYCMLIMYENFKIYFLLSFFFFNLIPRWSWGNMLASRSKVRGFKSSRRDFKLYVLSLKFQAC